jgi:hypothetical protein
MGLFTTIPHMHETKKQWLCLFLFLYEIPPDSETLDLEAQHNDTVQQIILETATKKMDQHSFCNS